MLSQKAIHKLGIARARFQDQCLSLNIHLAEPIVSQMTSMNFYAWDRGLKTGMYYLRSRPAADPIEFTVAVESLFKDGGQLQVRAKQEFFADEIDKKMNCITLIKGDFFFSIKQS